MLSRSQGRIEILDDVDAAEQHERQVVGDCDALGNGDVQEVADDVDRIKIPLVMSTTAGESAERRRRRMPHGLELCVQTRPQQRLQGPTGVRTGDSARDHGLPSAAH